MNGSSLIFLFDFRVHEARVVRSSPIYANNPLLPENQHLLGDSAYPLLRNLLNPFRDNGHLTEEQLRYNLKLSVVRSVVERTFVRLKDKFRRLKYLDIADPDFGTEIIVAACVLHNFTIIHDNNDADEEGQEDNGKNGQQGNVPVVQDQRQMGIHKRNNIVDLLRN